MIAARSDIFCFFGTRSGSVILFRDGGNGFLGLVLVAVGRHCCGGFSWLACTKLIERVPGFVQPGGVYRVLIAESVQCSGLFNMLVCNRGVEGSTLGLLSLTAYLGNLEVVSCDNVDLDQVGTR